MSDIQRLRRGLQHWWVKAERARWKYGVLGRKGTDSSAQGDKQDCLWVRFDTGTIDQVYNPHGVDDRVNLPVRVRDDGGRLIIDGINTSGLLIGDANAPGKVYSVNSKTGYVELDTDDISEGATNLYYTAERARDDVGAALVAGTNITITVNDGLDTITIDASVTAAVDSVNGQTGTVILDPDDLDDTATTNKFTTAAEISKLAGIEAGADVTDDVNVGTAIHGATGKTTPVDADEWALIDTAASNVLKKVTGTNLKAYLKTYFDTLYDLTATAIAALSGKTTPVDADGFVIADSAASNAPKKVTGTNLKAYLKTYFDTLYNLYVHPNHTGDVTSTGDGATVIGTNKVLTAMIADAQITLAKMANLAQATIIGRASGAGTGVPTALTAAQVVAIIQASIDHGSIAGLGDDDHTQYALLAGRSGGQVLYGGTGSGNSLTLYGTSHATKGPVLIGSDGGQLRVGANAPALTQAGMTLANTIDKATAGFANLASFGSSDASSQLQLLYGLYGSATAAERKAIIQGIEQSVAFRDLMLQSFGGKVGLGMDHATSIGANYAGVRTGVNTNDAAVGGVLYVTTTQTGNVGTGEDDLASYSVPANTLAVNGQSLWFEAWGTFAANSNSKTVRVRFGTSGTNLICTLTGILNGGGWSIRGRIIRTGAATQKANGTSIASANGTADSDTATGLDQTLSGAVTLKVSGEATTTNDIVLESFIVGWDDVNS